MKFRLLLSVLLFPFVAAGSAIAATIYIDFGPNLAESGVAAAGKGETTGQPQTWNNYTDNTGTAVLGLLDTTGAATGYTLATSGAWIDYFESANPSPSPYVTTASGDALYSSAARTITLSGLDNLLTYSITVFGYANRDTSRLTNVTINGVTQGYEPSDTNGPDNINNNADDNRDGGSVTFSNLSPTAGAITLNIASGIGNNAILSVIEITSVPEPSSALLLGSALILCFHRRRLSA